MTTMTEQDDNKDSEDVDDIQNTHIMFWSGLQMGCTDLYTHFQDQHRRGLVTDEDMAALVIDRLAEEERGLAKQILEEMDTEALKELLADPLCSPKVIDYIQVAEVRGGISPLLQAASQLEVDKVRLLLEAGANPNVNDLFDNSAMHMVLGSNSAEDESVQAIMKLLIEYGYDTTCVNSEQGKTAFEVHYPPSDQEEDDYFGEGLYQAFDVVPWSQIEEAILMDASSDEDGDQQVVQIVRRLVDLGWGPGADKDAIKGKEKRENGGCVIRDRLQLVNQVVAPVNEKLLYLYYWDERDGPQYEGWWVADGLGSNNYFFCNIACNETPPGPRNWRYSGDEEVDPEMRFVPIYDDEVEEGIPVENAPVVGYKLDYTSSVYHERVFKLTKQTFHGKPVYAAGQESSKLEDRCTLLVEKVLLPLLHLAAQQRLEDTDEAPCKQFARYLLQSRVASVCQEKVIAASEQGLAVLEEVLHQYYEEVGPALNAGCGPQKAMVGSYVGFNRMNQFHVHGGLDWFMLTGDSFLLKSVVVLCQEGYTLEEICDAFSALGWNSKQLYRSSVYALWLIKVATRCNANLVHAIESRLAENDDEEMKARIHSGPIKHHRRILEKRTDYRDHIFNGRNHDVGGVADIARLSVECPTPEDMIHCFNAITGANIDEHGFEVVRIKNGFSAANVKPSGGYRDVKFNLRVRGPEGQHDTIAEVQLLLKKFLDIKKHMHLLYEVVRGSSF